jgi:hypothetical protein
LHTRTNSACHKVQIFTTSEADGVLQLTGSEGVKVMNTLWSLALVSQFWKVIMTSWLLICKCWGSELSSNLNDNEDSLHHEA